MSREEWASINKYQFLEGLKEPELQTWIEADSEEAKHHGVVHNFYEVLAQYYIGEMNPNHVGVPTFAAYAAGGDTRQPHAYSSGRDLFLPTRHARSALGVVTANALIVPLKSLTGQKFSDERGGPSRLWHRSPLRTPCPQHGQGDRSHSTGHTHGGGSSCLSTTWHRLEWEGCVSKHWCCRKYGHKATKCPNHCW